MRIASIMMNVRRITAAISLTGLAALSTGIEPADAQSVPTCDGFEATIIGTNGDDNLRGTSARDIIVGLSGNDRIYGMGDNDVICSDGGDYLLGEDGAIGGAGNDFLWGGRNRGRLWDNDNFNTINGESSVDACVNSWYEVGMTFSCERDLIAMPRP